MLRTLLISLTLVAAAIALAMGGVRGFSDGGLRHADGILVLDGTLSGMSGSSSEGLSDGGLLGLSDGGLLGLSDGGLLGLSDGGLRLDDDPEQDPTGLSDGGLLGLSDGGLL